MIYEWAVVYGRGRDAVLLGHITTNHGISKMNALNILGIDMDAYALEHGWDGWDLDEIRFVDVLEKLLADWVRDNAPSEISVDECRFFVNGVPVSLERAADALIGHVNETVDAPYDESLTDCELDYLGNMMLAIINHEVSARYDQVRIQCETVRDGYAIYDADGNVDEVFRTRQEAMEWLQSGVNAAVEDYDSTYQVAPYRGVIE